MSIKTIVSLIFVVFVTLLDAKTLLVLLKGIENNHTLHMTYGQKLFVCQPYGVETVSQLIQRTDVNSTCMKYLVDFRKANLKERFYAQEILYVQQQYSVEGINESCLLNLSSNYTYSEALLENGYGRIPLIIKYGNDAMNERFKRAVQRAKNTNAGIWSDANIRECFLIEKKK
ncbi:hypothetical protein ACFLR3_02660 [Campylobacterota bacterium]